MSAANPLWGAPRIHGELLKLGIRVAQFTIAKHVVKHHRPPSQGWRTFLSNHVDGIAAIDLFVVPTVAFRILYCLVILRHDRRRLVSFGVTSSPTAEWIARQITEAFPWDDAPGYLIHDRDGAMARLSHGDFERWESVTARSLHGLRGRTDRLRGSSDRYAGNAWITWSFSARATCAEP